MTNDILDVKYRLFALVWLAMVIILPACNNEPTPSRWDEAQQASSEGQATADEALSGSAFNQFFPASKDGMEVVYTQEKEGFAEAVLTEEDEEVATLSVSDTASNPDAAEKYQDSTETLAGYPVLEIGSEGTGILVAGRFQVQVRSKVDDFGPEDRKSWLSAFDLTGLAGLQ